MQGRIENELKINDKVKRILKSSPKYMTEWYDNLAAAGKTAATCHDYIQKIHKFLCFIDKNPKRVSVDMITETTFDSYFNSIKYKTDKSGKIIETSGSLRLTTWYALNSFCEFLYKRNYIDKNYVASGISKPKNNDLTRINANRMLLTKEDFQAILKHAEHSTYWRSDRFGLEIRDYAILLTFMSTGMRKTALTSINIEDVDFENMKLTVVDKGNSFIQYTLSNKLASALNTWLEYRATLALKNENALFVSTNGVRISASSIDKLVDKYCMGALGYHVSPHKLRSGFVTIMVNETGNIALASKMVGHKNISTTQRYYATAGKEMEQAASIIDNVL